MLAGFLARDLLWKWFSQACDSARAWFQRCGKAFVVRGLALFGSVGQRAFAHSIRMLGRSWEVLLLPFEERADGNQ